MTSTGENEDLYGANSLPQNEIGAESDLNQVLQNLASSQTKDNRGSIVTAVVAITIVLIAGLVMWWYRTNY